MPAFRTVEGFGNIRQNAVFARYRIKITRDIHAGQVIAVIVRTDHEIHTVLHRAIRHNLNRICESERAVDDRLDFSPANPVIEYNLTFKTAALAAETNINSKDPLFVDPQQRNFRL